MANHERLLEVHYLVLNLRDLLLRGTQRQQGLRQGGRRALRKVELRV